MSGQVSPRSQAVRARLAAQQTRDTKIELGLRRALFARGLRYRVQYPVPGMVRRTIDIAFPKLQIAVFVDGCFWHGCPVHSVPVKNNADWWRRKLAENAARDRQTDEHLRHDGWRVLRLWEHVPLADAVDQVHLLVVPSPAG